MGEVIFSFSFLDGSFDNENIVTLEICTIA